MLQSIYFFSQTFKSFCQQYALLSVQLSPPMGTCPLRGVLHSGLSCHILSCSVASCSGLMKSNVFLRVNNALAASRALRGGTREKARGQTADQSALMISPLIRFSLPEGGMMAPCDCKPWLLFVHLSTLICWMHRCTTVTCRAPFKQALRGREDKSLCCLLKI